MDTRRRVLQSFVDGAAQPCFGQHPLQLGPRRLPYLPRNRVEALNQRKARPQRACRQLQDVRQLRCEKPCERRSTKVCRIASGKTMTNDQRSRPGRPGLPAATPERERSRRRCAQMVMSSPTRSGEPARSQHVVKPTAQATLSLSGPLHPPASRWSTWHGDDRAAPWQPPGPACCHPVGLQDDGEAGRAVAAHHPQDHVGDQGQRPPRQIAASPIGLIW